jgi:3',5'-cyclic-AMP phosphodiesterase
MKTRSTMRFTSIETKHEAERRALFQSLRQLDRRSFMKMSLAAAGAARAQGVRFHPHGFQPVRVAQAQSQADPAFRFAYISDSHLYERDVNDRFVRSLLRAVDDINHLDPQPDFVLYGGDLAQLGQPKELDLGAEILKNIKAPVRMMVGEHDWFLDMGEKWRDLFGEPTYAFDHKNVHFVVLNSILEDDFWTARGITPMERMKTVTGLDNGLQSRFKVGDEQRAWLERDLA